MRAAGAIRRLLCGNERFAITGATGWFGSVALDLLDEVLGVDLAARSVVAYGSKWKETVTSLGRSVEVRSLERLDEDLCSPTLILHFAYVTRERVAEMGLEGFVLANLRITSRVLAALDTGHVAGLALTSSGVARAATDLNSEPYGYLKRLDELALSSAAKRAGATAALARVFAVAGPHMIKPTRFAMGDLIQMAHRGGPLVVRSSAPVYRSYTGVDEVVALQIASLLSRQNVCFETAGQVVEVGALAALVAEVHHLPSDSVRRESISAAPTDTYLGDPSELGRLAQQFGLTLRTLRELVVETSAWMKETR